MTKAQIIAQVLESYGVNLDAGMSKAALVEEAQRLSGLAVLSTPRVADPEPSETENQALDPQPPAAEPIEPAFADEVPSVPADLLI
jgi:hypothetical protein